MMLNRYSQGFSLVEVTLALGIIAFALLLLIALIPAGVEANKISYEETQAVNIATMIISDLKNASFSDSSTSTPLFAIGDPYSIDSDGLATVLALVGSQETVYVSDGQQSGGSFFPGARYRCTVRYIRVAGASPDVTPIEAVLSITWPPLVDPDSAPEDVQGRVDTFFTIPHPNAYNLATY